MASGWSRARCPASRWGQFCLSSTGRPAAPKGRSLRLCSQCARAAGAGGIQEQSDRQGQGRRCRGGERQGPGGPVGQACEGGRQGRDAPSSDAAAPEPQPSEAGQQWQERGEVGRPGRGRPVARLSMGWPVAGQPRSAPVTAGAADRALFRFRAAPARASAQGDCSDECGDVSPRGLSGGSYCESASDGDCDDYDVNWAWANVREDAWAECNEIGCISAAALAPPRRAWVRAAPAVVEGGGFERRAWADDTSGSPGMGESVASKREARAAPSRPP